MMTKNNQTRVGWRSRGSRRVEPLQFLSFSLSLLYFTILISIYKVIYETTTDNKQMKKVKDDVDVVSGRWMTTMTGLETYQAPNNRYLIYRII